MKSNVAVMLILLFASQVMAFLGFESWKLSAGFMETNCRASENVANDLGGNPNDDMAITFSIQTMNDYGDQPGRYKIRYGILISTTHQWNYWDTPDTLEHIYDEHLGYGYGAYRIAFIPEIHARKGKFDYSFGVGVGIGYSKHFFDDNTGDNDNEDVFEGFIRPQISVGYGVKTIVALTAGYHRPFLGTYGRYWYKDPDWNSVYYGFSPGELDGLVIQLGIVFKD